MNSVRSFFPLRKDTQNLPMQQNQLITIRKLFNYILQKNARFKYFFNLTALIISIF